MNDFSWLLEKEIPRLRHYARALTRDMSRADDLVQDTLVRAIAQQHRWQYDSNLAATAPVGARDAEPAEHRYFRLPAVDAGVIGLFSSIIYAP